MKKIFLATFLSFLFLVSFSKENKESISCSLNKIDLNLNSSEKKMDIGEVAVITITACGQTGTFTFNEPFTLTLILAAIVSIGEEFCHQGPCSA